MSVVLLYEDDEDDEKELCANAELVKGGNAASTGPRYGMNLRVT